jgi:hypothetical protein
MCAAVELRVGSITLPKICTVANVAPDLPNNSTRPAVVRLASQIVHRRSSFVALSNIVVGPYHGIRETLACWPIVIAMSSIV